MSSSTSGESRTDEIPTTLNMVLQNPSLRVVSLTVQDMYAFPMSSGWSSPQSSSLCTESMRQ